MYRKTEADTILPPGHNPRSPASSYPEIDLTYWINSRDYEHHTYLNRIKPKLPLLLVKKKNLQVCTLWLRAKIVKIRGTFKYFLVLFFVCMLRSAFDGDAIVCLPRLCLIQERRSLQLLALAWQGNSSAVLNIYRSISIIHTCDEEKTWRFTSFRRILAEDKFIHCSLSNARSFRDYNCSRNIFRG